MAKLAVFMFSLVTIAVHGLWTKGNHFKHPFLYKMLNNGCVSILKVNLFAKGKHVFFLDSAYGKKK